MDAKELIILYIHGMGGGGDSRIPSVLSQHPPVKKSYSFPC